MHRASVALEDLEAAIFACLWNLSCGLNQRPRYVVHFAGETSFSVLGMFDGMSMEGLGFWFFIFVKCMSLFFTWSVFRPLLASHLCVSSNAMEIICTAKPKGSLVGPTTPWLPTRDGPRHGL